MKDSVKNVLAVVCGVLFSLAMFVIMLFNAVESVAFNLNRYQEAYEKYDRPAYIGISMEELMNVTSGMLDYLKGQRPALDMQATIHGELRQVFDQREIAHMQDVQRLFLGGFFLRKIMYGLVALALLGMGLAGAGRSVRRWAGCWYATLGVLGALAVAYAIWCMVDFTSAFTAFHHALFTNDLWLLDPSYEVLIQMFPEAFFNETAAAILLRFGGYLVLLTGLAAGVTVWNKKTREAFNQHVAL